MNLFNAYKYLYYRIYSWQLRWWGEDDVPEFTAVIGVSILMSLNIYGLLLIIDVLTGFSIIEQLNIGKLKLGLMILLVVIINSHIFLYEKRYKQIASQFIEENDFVKKIKLIFVFGYVFFSFAIIFIISHFYSPEQLKLLM